MTFPASFPFPPKPKLADMQEFYTSGKWVKPANATFVYVEAIGGGQSGRASGAGTIANAEGGMGGYYADRLVLASQLPDGVIVSIGAGGAIAAQNSQNGGGNQNNGGNSTFGNVLSAYGGGVLGSVSDASALQGNTYGPGYGGRIGGGSSIKAGGGGGGANSNGLTTPGGTSLLAGNGGDCATVHNANGSPGFAPGGGGGGASGTGLSGAGAPGRIRVWTW